MFALSTYVSTEKFQTDQSNAELHGSPTIAVFMAMAMIIVIAGSIVTHGTALAFGSIVFFSVAILCSAVRNPLLALCLYFTYAALEGMYKYMSNSAQIIYAIKPVMILVLLASWLMTNHVNAKKNHVPPYAVIFGLFILYSFVGAVTPQSAGIGSGIITALVWYIMPIGFYFMGYNTMRSPKQIVTLLYTFVGICTVVSAFTFVQYAMGRDWTVAMVPGYVNLKFNYWFGVDASGSRIISFRPASTTSQEGGGTLWSHLGMMSALILLLMPNIRPYLKIGLSACMIVNIAGLLVSGVRLMLIVGLMEIALLLIMTSHSSRAIKRNLCIGGVIVFAGLIGFSLAQMSSNGAIVSRYAETLTDPFAKYTKERGGVGGSISYVVEFLAENPMGVGYQRGTGSWKEAMGSNIVVNRETQFAAISGDMGIIGLLLLLALVFVVIRSSLRSWQQLKTPTFRTLGAFAFILLIGYCVCYWVSPVMQAIGDVFWLLVAISFALPMTERSIVFSGVQSGEKAASKLHASDGRNY